MTSFQFTAISSQKRLAKFKSWDLCNTRAFEFRYNFFEITTKKITSLTLFLLPSHENVRALRPYQTRHPRPALPACNQAHQNTFLTNNFIPNCTREQAKQTFLRRPGGLLWLEGGARPSALWVNSGGGTIEQPGAEMRRPSPQRPVRLHSPTGFITAHSINRGFLMRNILEH